MTNTLTSLNIISVGPGNPKWLTVEAVEWIKSCDVLAVPAPRGDEVSTAESIAREYIGEDSKILYMELPMTYDVSLLETSWAEAAKGIYEKIKEGKKVGFLVLGDASLYGSSTYVAAALQKIDSAITLCITPGVISPTACAARLGKPLALGGENVTILPDTELNEDLEKALTLGGTIVMMKISRSLQNLINYFEEKKLLDYATVVVKGGRGDEEEIYENVIELRGKNVPYMSLMILKLPEAVELVEEPLNELPGSFDNLKPAEGKGKVFVVGFGPGHREHLTYRAREAIKSSDCVVGYITYLKLIRELLDGKEIVRGGMTEEVGRAITAVEEARKGKIVSIISSGDAGVYGMAAPVFEVLMEQGWKPGDDPEVEVVPGITSVNACSTLLGAPLSHDFCTISLSDLLTPWQTIEERLEAAAQGDFITGLYNPKSGRRTEQIVKAQEIFLKHRDPDTPVGLIKSGFRKRQKVDVTTLKDFLNYDIGMLTTVIIGNSSTTNYEGLLITPRGYKRKYNLSENTVLEGVDESPIGGSWSMGGKPSSTRD